MPCERGWRIPRLRHWVELREILLRDKPETFLADLTLGARAVSGTGAGVVDESLDVMRWPLGAPIPERWRWRAERGPGTGSCAVTDRSRHALEPDENLRRAFPGGRIRWRHREWPRSFPLAGSGKRSLERVLFGAPSIAVITQSCRLCRQFRQYCRAWFGRRSDGKGGKVWLESFSQHLSSPRSKWAKVPRRGQTGRSGGDVSSKVR